MQKNGLAYLDQPVYPQFNTIQDGKSDQLLKLGIETKLSHTLIGQFKIAKNVIIEDGTKQGHLKRHEIYNMLTTVEKLTISEVNSKIYYITSQKITHLTIQYQNKQNNTFPDPTVQDNAECLLKKCTKITFYSQRGGGLNVKSINSLLQGPIKTLSLEDVELTDYSNFLRKLSLNESLETINLRGELSKDPLEHLLIGPFIYKNKIKHLEIEIRRMDYAHYRNIALFTSLQSIKINYEPREFPTLTNILASLDMVTLKKIEIITIPPTTVPEVEHDNRYDEEILNEYGNMFTRRGINYTIRPQQQSEEEIFLESLELMEVDEEYINLLFPNPTA